MTIFKRVWQKIKVPSCPWAFGFQLALIRPQNEMHHVSELPVVLKVQAVKVKKEKNIHWSKEIGDFFIFQLWGLFFLEPLGIQRRYVPHFKGLISATLARKSIRPGCKSSTVIADLRRIHWFIENLSLVAIKALIRGYLEPKKLRARPKNEAATPIWMKIDNFHLKDCAGFVWRPSPLSLLQLIATY